MSHTSVRSNAAAVVWDSEPSGESSAVRPSVRVRTTPKAPNARRLDRRAVYLGEGLTMKVQSAAGELSAEVIDIFTPEGLGVAVLDDSALPSVGDVVAIEHTGRATAGIRQRAVVRSVTESRLGGRTLPRIGLSLVAEKTGGATAERRRADRHACPETLPALASAMCPLFFREWLHFAVKQIGAGGMTLTTSTRNKALLPGLELGFTVTLPISGAQQVRGRITSVRRDGASEFVVGVAWVAPSRALLTAVSEYLLLGDEGLTPARLREGGLTVGSIDRAVTYDYARTPADHAEILALRLRAHNAEGRLENALSADLASPHDAHSRHLTCRFGGRIVGYYRVNFVDGNPARSQYVTEGGHEIPGWLWDAGFVEAGAAAIDPEFQRGGLYLALLQHTLRVGMQAGYKYLVAAVCDELLPMYERMGFKVADTRMVEPKPGWRFRSHLIWIGVDELASGELEGESSTALASVVTFASA